MVFELPTGSYDNRTVAEDLLRQTYEPGGPGEDALEEYARRLIAPGTARRPAVSRCRSG